MEKHCRKHRLTKAQLALCDYFNWNPDVRYLSKWQVIETLKSLDSMSVTYVHVNSHHYLALDGFVFEPNYAIEIDGVGNSAQVGLTVNRALYKYLKQRKRIHDTRRNSVQSQNR